MTSERQVEQALNEVLVPGVGRSIVQLNMVRGIEVADNTVKVSLASTALSLNSQDWIRDRTKVAVEKLSEVNKVEVEFIERKPAELNRVQHVIAVMSGKGGVGKSLIASLWQLP